MKTNWEVKPLSGLLKVQNGYAFDSKLFSFSDGMPLIRIRDLKNGYSTETNFVGSYDEKYEVKAGDFLIGMDGEFGCYEWKGSNALLNQRVCRLCEFTDKIFPRFLFYGINSYLKAIEDVTAFATVKHISSKQIENILMPLPPLDEQKRIVAILDEAFAAIDKAKANAETNLQNARALFESYLQSVFANPGEGWEEKRIGEIADFRNGLNFTKSSKGETIKIVGVKDFQKSYWIPFDSLETVTIGGALSTIDYLKEGDILAVRSNGNQELIGRSILAGPVTEKTSHSGFTIRIRLNQKNVFPQYLCHFLKSKEARRQLASSGTGTNIKSLNQGALSSLVLPLPSFNDQQVIIDKIEEVFAETKRLEVIYQQKLVDLAELKKAILQKAFQGELAATPESALAETVA